MDTLAAAVKRMWEGNETEVGTFPKETVSTGRQGVCWARELSALENPAHHVLKVPTIHKCLQPFLQRNRMAGGRAVLRDQAPGCTP